MLFTITDDVHAPTYGPLRAAELESIQMTVGHRTSCAQIAAELLHHNHDTVGHSTTNLSTTTRFDVANNNHTTR